MLNDEQSRRLATSAIMLRLLEAQLRTELQSLTSGLERDATRRANEEKPKPMTQATLCKLRKTKVDIDMLCSQPSCPVCSEDFQLQMQITQMPCSHIFHAPCVLPWLDVKRTCPICRFELTEGNPLFPPSTPHIISTLSNHSRASVFSRPPLSLVYLS